MIKKEEKISNLFKYYFDIRMLRILLLGAISGFPWVLIGSSLSLWLKEEGLSRSTIGWAGLIFGVYAFNYLWAPLIDRIQIPFLTKKIGHRRGWIVLMQLVILISLIPLSKISSTNFKILSLVLDIIIIFSFSAVLAGIAGALYVPQVGIINPGEFSPIKSIEIVVWVALGGRGFLYGAIIGAIVVNVLKSYLTIISPEIWIIFLGK